jgi:hypothetical protein
MKLQDEFKARNTETGIVVTFTRNVDNVGFFDATWDTRIQTYNNIYRDYDVEGWLASGYMILEEEVKLPKEFKFVVTKRGDDYDYTANLLSDGTDYHITWEGCGNGAYYPKSKVEEFVRNKVWEILSEAFTGSVGNAQAEVNAEVATTPKQTLLERIKEFTEATSGEVVVGMDGYKVWTDKTGGRLEAKTDEDLLKLLAAIEVIYFAAF